MSSNALQWKKEFPSWREVWFYKISAAHPDPSKYCAFWFRYEILVPKKETHLAPRCEVWAVAFRKEGALFALKHSQHLSLLQQCPEAISFGKHQFSDSSLEAALNSGSNSIQWKLNLKRNLAETELLPSWLAARHLTPARAVTPHFDSSALGEITLNGETYRLSQAPAMQGHYWAPRMSHEWAWGHGNVWKYEAREGRPLSEQKLVWEGISGRTKSGPFLLPPLTAMFVSWNGRRVAFHRLQNLLSAKSHYSLGEWHFCARNDEWKIEGKLKADQKHIVGVQYTDVTGLPVYCYNSMIASGELLLFQQRRPGHWIEVLKASADKTVGFEYATRKKYPDIPILL